MNELMEVKRMIAAPVAPLKLLSFETDYKKGQLDMAETIDRLIDVAMDTDMVARAKAAGEDSDG